MTITEIRFSLESPVQLVNCSRKLTVVSFPKGLQGRATFGREYGHIEAAMRVIGIDIPVNGVSLKTKARRIHLEDENFGVAFYQFYYSTKMDPKVFQWQSYTP